MDRKSKIKFLKEVIENGKLIHRKTIDIDKCTVDQLSTLLALRRRLDNGEDVDDEFKKLLPSLPVKLVLNT